MDRAVGSGALPVSAALTESREGLTVLRLANTGACTAFEPATAGRPALCAIHRVLGPEALPTACRHFPRVCLLDARGTSITLSHFCPTAASLLFEEGPIAVVDDAPRFPADPTWEGLDARDTLPPLLAPGMLLDLEDYAAWETRALAVLDDDRHSPERALEILAADVERVRTWTPRRGPFLTLLSGSDPSGSDPVGSDPLGSDPLESKGRRFLTVTRCVADGLARPRLPAAFEILDERWVAPCWTAWSGPLRRYLAARLHASWVPYQGRGLRTIVESLAASLAVVRVEAVRACEVAGQPLDRERLSRAFRAADRLLVHETDAQALAHAWSAVEDGIAR